MIFDAGTAGCESYIAHGAAAVAKNIATEKWRCYFVADDEEGKEDNDSFRSDLESEAEDA